ncbi:MULTISPECIES: MarR family winged helix-turn-helix transcriptional regulator [Loigolactobacillus]|uniref:Uncharacterized protein n=1 Tax=Loigolactobacillus backii TaxID=375175 RepID=A0A192GZL4_9LACO|nr:MULTISPECIES: MarR family transcriptional regulator [Loigolactobacillus]ANK61432.1 hypothetical protein AYR53_00860 [Loigolactobacillus backii]ANK69368.1 hypothetical protein AYR56_03855 [Loigolactobacillus backii]MDA5387773.1 MarR family transcriptional regulator [Loigolactobacillus backii]MDA5390936.1 MarR family transcriptional regulator [Loigolactobacillus backii]PIO84182.1 MarR family transcriptional regulator [Loigolactobacillus backii]
MEKNSNNSELFGQLFMTLTQAITKSHSLEEFGLTRLQAITLRNVYKRPGTTMTELAKTIGITRPQLTRIIGTLEERGLLQRQHNEENRRVVNVYRTEKGKAVVKEHMQLIQGRIQERINTLSSSDRKDLSVHLQETIRLMAKAKILELDSIDN